jgi:hypothetical protein
VDQDASGMIVLLGGRLDAATNSWGFADAAWWATAAIRRKKDAIAGIIFAVTCAKRMYGNIVPVFPTQSDGTRAYIAGNILPSNIHSRA